jgi:hypothetical protein
METLPATPAGLRGAVSVESLITYFLTMPRSTALITRNNHARVAKTARAADTNFGVCL